ncbi:MAG: DNA repair protein RadC [Bacteroidota bacterium]
MQDKRNSFSIKHWAEDDKPREKLLSKGYNAISDAELVAILIGSGNREESAVELAKRILAHSDNNLNRLGRLSIPQLMQFKGIGTAKAVIISAALEMGRRRRSQDVPRVIAVGNSQSAYELLYPLIGDLLHEEFWIVYLNNSNKVLHKEQLSKGGITGTLVDIRLVLKQALERGAVGLILAHNHPSGALKPSNADKQITKKLKSAAQTLDIKVLDHLVIAQNAYFSFADEGIL